MLAEVETGIAPEVDPADIRDDVLLRDQVDLARRALEFEGLDEAMRAEVLLFLDTCAADAVAAGDRLQRQVIGLAEVMAPGVAVEMQRFDWQGRKDCGI